MCGFAGTTRATSGTVGRFIARLRHRGPDDTGFWQEGPVGLAHTRLAIIDLSPGGHQPMASPCGRWIIAYNGEIYNYRELRSALEAAGETFHTSSDTEVLLRLLMREGTAALARISGMFALALWDRERRELVLARDRLGIKPIVYSPLPGGEIAFASEIAALEEQEGFDATIDRDAISEYLACLYVPAPRTARRGARKLPPGHVLHWRDGKTTIERYWRPRIVGHRTLSLTAATDELLPILRAAIVDHMVADVPVGCFLSGGIDSSVIAALMAEEARRIGAPPIRTFTMTFGERAYDERESARAVSDHIGSVHTELPASSGDVVDRIPEMLRAFGEPFGNPTALLVDSLSAAARQHVSVALVGDGGDEVFAGYPRYSGGLLAQRYRNAVPRWIRSDVLAPLAEWIPESSSGRHGWRRAREFLSAANLDDPEMYASWVEYFSPRERAALLDLDHIPERPIAAVYRSVSSAAALDAMQETDLGTFLPGNLLSYGDAMSMAHALELRLPLLDHRVVETVGQMQPSLRFAHGKKTLLREIATRLLPSSVVNRPKRGFNPPMGLWLKAELLPLVDEHLCPSRLEAIGIAPQPVAKLLAEQRSGRRDHALKIWALLMLEIWASTPGAHNTKGDFDGARAAVAV